MTRSHHHHLMRTSKFKRYAVGLVGPSLALVFLSLAGAKFQTSEAFLNCFTPNMFKMGGKGQQQLPPGLAASHSGERASWYGQPTVQAPPPAYFYGRNPMSRLFGPKMGGGGGGGLFGTKRWMDWRSNSGANMNFYRPGYGYGYGWSPQQQQPQYLIPGTGQSGYNYNTPQLADQLNQQPAYNTQVPGGNQLINNAGGYGQSPPQQQQLNTNNNDGWTVPYVNPYGRPSQQLQLPYGGDSYSVSPGANQQQQQQQQQKQSGKQQVDSYGGGGGGTKGGTGGNRQQQQQQQGQYGTTKNVLIADGGYVSHDAHLMARPGYAQQAFGYSYPEWYSGSVDSPAKIAQQLYRIQQRRRLMMGFR